MYMAMKWNAEEIFALQVVNCSVCPSKTNLKGGHYWFFSIVASNLRRQTLWMLLGSHLLRCFPKIFLPWAAKSVGTVVHQWHQNRPHSPCPETKTSKFGVKGFICHQWKYWKYYKQIDYTSYFISFWAYLYFGFAWILCTKP